MIQAQREFSYRELKVKSLDGKKVLNNAESLDELVKGTYIINGEKELWLSGRLSSLNYPPTSGTRSESWPPCLEQAGEVLWVQEIELAGDFADGEQSRCQAGFSTVYQVLMDVVEGGDARLLTH